MIEYSENVQDFCYTKNVELWRKFPDMLSDVANMMCYCQKNMDFSVKREYNNENDNSIGYLKENDTVRGNSHEA